MINKLPHTMPGPVIYGAMILGLLAAVAFRILTIVEALNPAWVRPIWYFAVLGYIVFFTYRYFITEKRKRVITANRLREKVMAGEKLTGDDRELLNYVLSSVVKSKEHINYIFIVAVSLLVVAADILLTICYS